LPDSLAAPLRYAPVQPMDLHPAAGVIATPNALVRRFGRFGSRWWFSARPAIGVLFISSVKSTVYVWQAKCFSKGQEAKR
jgi:hypothetical protein